MELEFVVMFVAIFMIVGIMIWCLIDESKAREAYIEDLKKKGYRVIYIYKN